MIEGALGGSGQAVPAAELCLVWRSGERLRGGVWHSEPSEEAGDDTVTYTGWESYMWNLAAMKLSSHFATREE